MTASSTSTAASSSTQRVFAMLKIPLFWPENTTLWFAQIESQFTLYGITDDSVMFNHIVANLDGKVLQYVSDAVVCPPVADKYKNIKEKITECFAESSQKKMEKLLSDLTLGEQKPSQLLNRQRDLGGSAISDDFLKTLWLRQLPVNVQSILAASTGSLTQMAQLADKIVEVSQPANNTVSVVSDSEATIAMLRKKVDNLEKQLHSRSSRTRSRSSTSKERSASEVNKHDTCWYHWKFGEKASKCRPPCKSSKN